jgi:chorismate mutase-like protein
MADPNWIKTLLAPYRAEIDAVDDAIVELLAKRVAIVHRVAAIKMEHNIPAVLPDRIEQVVARNAARGADKGVDGDMLAAIYRVIIANACGLEDRIIYDGRAKS